MRQVRAAGAVLWRRVASADGDTRLIAVIHRPKYDDWSLPKGKLDPGEDDRTAALREIREETGQDGSILRDLGEVRYVAEKKGETIDKVVRYFEMRVGSRGTFVPDDEVDDLRWLPLHEVHSLLSYDEDRTVLRRYEDVPRT